jgi:hypothetical protein
MGRYMIKTDKYNIFTGTRAEEIITDVGMGERIIEGELKYVLPALATLKDIDIKYNEETINEVELNGLISHTIINLKKKKRDLYFHLLNKYYKINISEKPLTKNPLIIANNLIKNYEDYYEDELIGEIDGFLGEYKNSVKVFTRLGECILNPLEEIINKLKCHTNVVWDNNNYSAFFNPSFTELIEDNDPEEIVFIGGDLADQIFYSSIGAKDLDSKPIITILKDKVICSNNIIYSVKDLIIEHIKYVLNSDLIYNPSFKYTNGIVIKF